MPLVESEEERRRRWATLPGMASWAGAVPGKHCCECAFWPSAGYNANGARRASPCDKYRQMMHGRPGKPVPPYTPACKYFLQRWSK